MSKRVFISRELRSDSPFLERLSTAGFTVFAQSLIQFNAVPFSMPPPADWVFCYSARSIEFFLKGLAALTRQADRYPNYAALGKGTARRLQELGISPAFVGSGAPEATAAAFLEKAKGQRVLFPRAEQSRQSIQRLLKDKLDMYDLVVYQNQLKADAEIPETDFVVLTSPMNVQAYVKHRGFSKNQRIVAIGQTTAGALSKLEISGFRIAGRASEEALAASVLNWEKL